MLGKTLVRFVLLVQLVQSHRLPDFMTTRVEDSGSTGSIGEHALAGHVTVKAVRRYQATTTTTSRGHRSTLETTAPKDFDVIQRKWHNWYYCTEFANNSQINDFEPRQYFAPDNYVFTSFSSRCNITVEKKGTIATGNRTIVFKLWDYLFLSLTNDFEKKQCFNTSQEVETYRAEQGVALNALMTTEEFKAGLYARVDGKDLPFFYLFDNRTNFLEECPGKELCGPDSCDFEPLVNCKGVDAWPQNGWYSLDTRTWGNGETHTFEMGSTNTTNGCSRTKFVITAVAPPTKAPTKAPTKSPTKAPTKTPTKAPTKKPCGLFGWRIFCPLTRCGVLGRLLKLCK